MGLLPGVYIGKKKSGEIYYRSSITYKNKHISLGSYPTEEAAHAAYLLAGRVINDKDTYTIDSYPEYEEGLPFDKWVILINFRDNGIYFKTPIYLKHRYFLYYIDQYAPFKFAVDDLFYYSTHTISRRGGHLFVADYGMQVNILSRYGIKNFAVEGRDFRFVNGDNTDFRYENIEIINKYHGVMEVMDKGVPTYISKIHINGDYIIGRFPTEVEAAVAYNKAAYLLWDKGVMKDFPLNYVSELSEKEYLVVYDKVKLSKKILNYSL